jgi:nitrile hydratase accessory protein
LTVALNEAGIFDWAEWTQILSEHLQSHGHERALDGGEDYFACWLEALETLLAHRHIAQPADIAKLKADWEKAYRSTPHGRPVRLR